LLSVRCRESFTPVGYCTTFRHPVSSSGVIVALPGCSGRVNPLVRCRINLRRDAPQEDRLFVLQTRTGHLFLPSIHWPLLVFSEWTLCPPWRLPPFWTDLTLNFDVLSTTKLCSSILLRFAARPRDSWPQVQLRKSHLP
jgi:hypothetical protein